MQLINSISAKCETARIQRLVWRSGQSEDKIMSITVNTNVYALSAQRNLSRTQATLQTAMQRLSSGLRINQAKDDAAGLAVAQRMEGQARGAAVAQRTLADGISFLSVADSTLRDLSDTLHRMRELAVQASTGTYTSNDRVKMDTEYQQLDLEVAAVQARGTFNGNAVVGTSADVVADANGGTISITGGTSVGQPGGAITTTGGATTALTAISSSLNTLATSLASIGAYQSRLEKAMSSAMAVEEAQWAARGRIMDADFAKETTNMTSAQIIQQAGVSALAQANQIPQLALGLLQ